MLANVDKLKNYEFSSFIKTESSIWDYYNMLIHYADYESYDLIQEKIIIYENVNSQNLINIREQMNLNILDKNDDEIKYLGYLKKIAYEKLHFEGNQLKDKRYDILSVQDIITTSKYEGFSLNCRYISHIFCQILLSVGFKARWVVCLPIDLNNTECHCVTEVYINKLQKWIVVDAAFGAFYFNEKGELLNLYEMRNLYISGSMPIIVANDMENVKELQLYWMKNLFRFKFITYNGTNALQNEQHYWGLNTKEFKMNNKKYIDKYKTKVEIVYSNDARAFW